jgi:hypothetical protein
MTTEFLRRSLKEEMMMAMMSLPMRIGAGDSSHKWAADGFGMKEVEDDVVDRRNGSEGWQ